MDRTPKILVFANEPMLTVDIMSELEARGFEVEPMNPGDRNGARPLKQLDVAVLDINGGGEPSMSFASDLLHSDLPVVILGASRDISRFGANAHVLPKPVDYNHLSDLLTRLAAQPHSTPHAQRSEQPEAFMTG